MNNVTGLRVVTRNLAVAFAARAQLALADIDLTIEPGERVAILGPSGCGKTTLLRALLGAVPATGEIRVGGLDPADSGQQRRLRRKCGVIRQSADLVPQLTARTNALAGVSYQFGLVDWGSLVLGYPPRRWASRLDQLAARHRVDHCLNTRAAYLSGGEKQRIALVRALLGQPGLVVADEPTSGLDPAAAGRVVDQLLDVGAGTTLLLTTHDRAVADRFPRKVGVRAGRVLFDQADVNSRELNELYGDPP
jgi:ABC-type phosphate/phosphonate transport system ATPase subunit